MISGDASPYTYVDDLWIVTAYFNPLGYETKVRNYDQFIERIDRSRLKWLVAECAFGDASFQLKRSPSVLQVRARDILWQKERLLNMAIEQLPPSCTKVAWLDCDIIFQNADWALQTSKLLDDFPVVQPFTTAVRLPRERMFSHTDDTFFTGFSARRQQAWHLAPAVPALAAVGADGSVWETSATEIAYCVACGSRTNVSDLCGCLGGISSTGGVVAAAVANPDVAAPPSELQKHGHTGFAWAARKDLLLAHGLYDASLSGTGDHLMAHAMCGDWSSPCIDRLLGGNPKHFDYFMAWGERLSRDVRGHMGCVDGQIDHLWHGDDEDRNYKQRGRELAAFDFDPAMDLRIGANRCWEWNSHKPALHRWCVNYFGLRREDG